MNVPGEDLYRNKGVAFCPHCDGPLFKGKRVAVIGGGNSAVEEALYLTHHAAHVTVIHRRDSFRAEKILQQRLFANPKVTVVWDTVVEDILGTQEPKGANGLRLRQVKTGEVAEMPIDGVFVAIGHSPTTALFKGQVAMDSDGYISTVPGSTRTSVDGVFAAGDVQDKVFRQAVTAAGTGCMAALEAEKWLAAQAVPATAMAAQ
jgi:thioredoxin reductase (NADPH)